MRIYLSFLAFIVCGAYCSSAEDTDPVAKTISGTRTASLGCGARAVYLMLKADGMTCKLSDISKDIEPHADGICSAKNIIDYLEQKNYSATLVNCTYDDLLTGNKRFILVLRYGGVNAQRLAHFALVYYSIKEGNLYLADPSESASLVLLDSNEIKKTWDGLAIMAEPRKSK